MREFSSNVLNVINSGTIKYFFLIDLYFSEHYRFTSFSSDITYDGNTYISDGGLFEVDAPQFSNILDKEAYKIVITDLVDEMASHFKTGVVGKKVQVKIGLLDEFGIPMTDTADILNLYTGYVDAPTIENNWDTKVAVIEGTSPLADLDSVNPFSSSKQSIRQRDATDSSFDEIYEDSEAEIKWGKV